MHQRRASFRQRGYAALILVAIIGLTLTALFVTSLNATQLRNEQNRKTLAALALAKQALIARAAVDQTIPGSFPCPDVDNDGVLTLGVDYSGPNCTSYLGRLPWRTLGLPDLRDANGERLWYTLSQNFRDASGVVINSTTAATLSVTGTVPATNVVAIVFSPGTILSGQIRGSVANQNNPANYLEGSNATGGPVFTSQASGNTFNDQLVTITAAELMPIVEKNVAREMMLILENYHAATGIYPWAADATGNSVDPTGNNGRNRGLFPCDTAQPTNWGDGGTASLPGWLTNGCGSTGWASVIYYAVSGPQLEDAGSACDHAHNYCVSNPHLKLNGSFGPDLVLLTPGTNGIFDDQNGVGGAQGDSDRFVTPTSTANDRDRIYTYP